MPLRLDNARALPTCPQQEQQKNQPVEPRFKIDHAASPMPETRQPERLAPRATSNRNGGRDHLGILGEIKSVHPGEIIGISTTAFFLAFIPQFVDPTAYVAAQFIVFGLISVALKTSVNLIVTYWAAKATAGFAKRPSFIAKTPRASGAVMVSLGATLLLARRAN
ncbi:LysE family translocator [Bradyrhizobium sp. LMG 9283]|uniref:LysE family translocator n=1 Tax=Bradyrhizobium sp. LMG 9283 TaxID=592064 RepID=UPI00388FEBF4